MASTTATKWLHLELHIQTWIHLYMDWVHRSAKTKPLKWSYQIRNCEVWQHSLSPSRESLSGELDVTLPFVNFHGADVEIIPAIANTWHATCGPISFGLCRRMPSKPLLVEGDHLKTSQNYSLNYRIFQIIQLNGKDTGRSTLESTTRKKIYHQGHFQVLLHTFKN